MFAKSAQMARTVISKLRDRQVDKFYIALSDRKPSKKQGTIAGDMIKGRRGSWMLQRTTSNNTAITKFISTAVPSGPSGLRAFVLKPTTGKTHQIRVAMKSLGSPVLGDERYASALEARLQQRGYLHAAALRLELDDDLIQIVCRPDQGDEFLRDGFQQVFTDMFSTVFRATSATAMEQQEWKVDSYPLFRSSSAFFIRQ